MTSENKKEDNHDNKVSPATVSDTRRKLLAAARRLFAERGYHETRPQDISREAGVGYGTFYLQFEDKLDCFMAFTTEAYNELNEFVAPYMKGATTFSEVIPAIINGSFDYSARNPGVLRAILEDVRLLSIYEKRSPEHSPAILMLKLIEDWQRQGVISRDIDKTLLGYLISGAVRQGDALIAQKTHTRDEVFNNIMLFIVRGAGFGRTPKVPVWDASKIDPLRPHSGENNILPAAGREDSDSGKENGLSPAQRKIHNRRKLFIAAKKLFSEAGYDAVGPKDIAALAGVGMGTFYAHFEDKLDCFLAVAEEASAELLDLAWKYVAAATTFDETVYFFMRASFDYSDANPGLYRAIVADQRILQTDRKVVTRGVDRVSSYIGNLKNMGKIDQSFDNRLLAYLIIGTLRQSDAYISRKPERHDDVIENATRFVINAISVP